MDFHQALNIAIAELTPQPWDYTAPDGTTLTVIPAGLPETPGCAEVLIRITPPDAPPVEAAVTTTDLPALGFALTRNGMWSHDVSDDLWIDLIPCGVHGTSLRFSDSPEPEEWMAEIHIPEGQRLPLASALSRALDAARGWED